VKLEDKVRSLASKHVSKNWIVLWKHLNAGGLVQHQAELREILVFFALKARRVRTKPQPRRKPVSKMKPIRLPESGYNPGAF
jgi:hypothetical protein